MVVAEYLFAAALATWTALSVLRFVGMYDAASPLQQWRRWDVFRIVPIGAFFSPSVPRTEHRIVIRDFPAEGVVTSWTETPWIRPRRWWHAIWNPQKHLYRAKTECARSLIAAAQQTQPAAGDTVSPALALSDSYVAILRYAASLPRAARPLATQFAVLELDVLSRDVVRSVISAVHEI